MKICKAKCCHSPVRVILLGLRGAGKMLPPSPLRSGILSSPLLTHRGSEHESHYRQLKPIPPFFLVINQHSSSQHHPSQLSNSSKQINCSYPTLVSALINK